MKFNILVVDDEEEWREKIGALINTLGYEPTVFSGFHEAEKELLKEEFPYSLIVTDNTMGHIRDAGITLASTARLMGIDVPIIVYSSDMTYEQESRAKALNAIYVKKSYAEMESLARVIQRLISQHPA